MLRSKPCGYSGKSVPERGDNQNSKKASVAGGECAGVSGRRQGAGRVQEGPKEAVTAFSLEILQVCFRKSGDIPVVPRTHQVPKKHLFIE